MPYTTRNDTKRARVHGVCQYTIPHPALTSQRYLNSSFVEENVGGIWKHNVILCVGPEVNPKSADIGMMWLSGYGVGPDIVEYPRRQQEMEKTCKQAAQLGTIGVILDGVPTSVKFHDADEAESEGFQVTGASYYKK